MSNLNPSQPCDTCAFVEGSAANRESRNHLRARICSLGGVPFFCHHATDGRELNWHGSTADYYESLAVAGEGRAAHRKQMRVCAGWKGEVMRHASLGFFSKFGVIRRAVAQHALDCLDSWLNPDEEPEEKLRAKKNLGRALRFLVKRNIEHERIPL